MTDQDAADARFLRVALAVGGGVVLVVGLVLGVSYFQDQARDACQVDQMFTDMTGGESQGC